MSSWRSSEMPDLTGKTAIVTGANSGIGLETARALAGKGARVTLACRSRDKAEAALSDIRSGDPDADVRLASLDLASLASIRAFASDYADQNESLDLLCNNAGVMMCPLSRTADGFEMQLGTNHLGHFSLTGLLLPLLLAANDARVVTVSSIYHRLGRIDFDDLGSERRYSSGGAYQQSKLANLLFTYELGRRLARGGQGLLSVASHPGWTATNLQRHSGLFRAMNPLFAQGPADGAWPSLYAATGKDVKGGDYFGPGGLLELKGPPKRVKSGARSHDVETASRLWKRSEEMTGVSYAL